MFEKIARELFELAVRVNEETRGYVSFEISKFSISILIENVSSPDSGWWDGEYHLYFYNDKSNASYDNQYKHAKAHMQRLLEEGRCPV